MNAASFPGRTQGLNLAKGMTKLSIPLLRSKALFKYKRSEKCCGAFQTAFNQNGPITALHYRDASLVHDARKLDLSPAPQLRVETVMHRD